MEQNGAYRHLYDSQMVLENYGKRGMHDEREKIQQNAEAPSGLWEA